MKLRTSKQQIIQDRLVGYGLLGTSFVALMTFAQRETLSEPMRYAVYFFVAAIPLLALTAYIAELDTTSEYSIDPVPMKYAGVLGALLAFIGLVFTTAHFSGAAACVFVASSVAASVGGYVFDKQWTESQVGPDSEHKQERPPTEPKQPDPPQGAA